ncbi:conserved hypothetical protein [Neospora caninum Liverpool]|uniref:SAC domain-containing protein n=1 Tax=Neospora caninum (strain Liverpool) TaxID=572307 RepID=F0VGS0_NEOCL|nr:conserved hypothetical protein [Neospora caninum Liverpool]CBZ52914.1 conserved hypothetical protein [Neospora caninum Liverpool]CEL66896.1 TPA: hypothetical protein BN1204_027020 [Neospora caninum Liverpool]|eukprot:XP_003882946.1 conserved hypothetical protein [Neospora caninum Liverpool]
MKAWEKIESYTVYNFPQHVVLLGAFSSPSPDVRNQGRRLDQPSSFPRSNVQGACDGSGQVRSCPCVGRIAFIQKQMISEEDLTRLSSRQRHKQDASSTAGAAVSVAAAQPSDVETREGLPSRLQRVLDRGLESGDATASAPARSVEIRKSLLSALTGLRARLSAGNTATSVTSVRASTVGTRAASSPVAPLRMHQRCVGSWECLLELREELHRLAEHAQRRRAQWRRAHNQIYRPMLLPEHAPPRVWATLHALAARIASTRESWGDAGRSSARMIPGPDSQSRQASSARTQPPLDGSRGAHSVSGEAQAADAPETSIEERGRESQWDGSMEADTGDNREGDGSLLVCGLLGAIRFLLGYYLVLATDSQEVAALGAVRSIEPRALRREGAGRDGVETGTGRRGKRKSGFREREEKTAKAYMFLDGASDTGTATPGDGERGAVHRVFTLRHVDLLPLFFFESSQERPFSSFCDLVEPQTTASGGDRENLASSAPRSKVETEAILRWLTKLSQDAKSAALAKKAEEPSVAFRLGKIAESSERTWTTSHAASGEIDPSAASCALPLFPLTAAQPFAWLRPTATLVEEHSKRAELLDAERRYQELFLQVFLRPALSFFYAHTLDLTQSLQAQGLHHAGRGLGQPESCEGAEPEGQREQGEREAPNSRERHRDEERPRWEEPRLELLHGKKLDAVFNLFLLEPFAVSSAAEARAPSPSHALQDAETSTDALQAPPETAAQPEVCAGSSASHRGENDAGTASQAPPVSRSSLRRPCGFDGAHAYTAAPCRVPRDMSPWLVILQQGCVVQKFFSAKRPSSETARNVVGGSEHPAFPAESNSLPLVPRAGSPPASLATPSLSPPAAEGGAGPTLETRAVSALAKETAKSFSPRPEESSSRTECAEETVPTKREPVQGASEERGKASGQSLLFSFVIIARRSRRAAGARWYRRGLAVAQRDGLSCATAETARGSTDAEPNAERPASGISADDSLSTHPLLDTDRDSAVAANQVECEQILWRVTRRSDEKQEHDDGPSLEPDRGASAVQGIEAESEFSRSPSSTAPLSSPSALSARSPARGIQASSSSSLPSRSHLQFTGDVASLVQVRGSVPVFWGHLPSQVSLLPSFLQHICPPVRLSSPALDPQYLHSKDHFDAMHRAYGCPILCLDLVRQKPCGHMETKLASAYREALAAINAMYREEEQVVLLRLQRALGSPEDSISTKPCAASCGDSRPERASCRVEHQPPANPAECDASELHCETRQGVGGDDTARERTAGDDGEEKGSRAQRDTQEGEVEDPHESGNKAGGRGGNNAEVGERVDGAAPKERRGESGRETEKDDKKGQRETTTNIDPVPGWTGRWALVNPTPEGDRVREHTVPLAPPRGPTCWTDEGVCFKCMYSRLGATSTDAFVGVPSACCVARPTDSRSVAFSLAFDSASPALPAFRSVFSAADSPSEAQETTFHGPPAFVASASLSNADCQITRERDGDHREAASRRKDGEEGGSGGSVSTSLETWKQTAEELHAMLQALTPRQQYTCCCEVAYEAFDWQDADKRLGFDQALHRLFALVAKSLQFTGSFVCYAKAKGRKIQSTCATRCGAESGGCEKQSRAGVGGVRGNERTRRKPDDTKAREPDEAPSGFVSQFQHGVIRINCVDCLDRTNLAMLGLGVAALYRHLTTLIRYRRLHGGAWHFAREGTLEDSAKQCRAPDSWWLRKTHRPTECKLTRDDTPEGNEETNDARSVSPSSSSSSPACSSSTSSSPASSSSTSSSPACSSSTSSSPACSSSTSSSPSSRPCTTPASVCVPDEESRKRESGPRDSCAPGLFASSSHSGCSSVDTEFASTSDESEDAAAASPSGASTPETDPELDPTLPAPSRAGSGALSESPRPRLTPSLSSSSLHAASSTCCWSPSPTRTSRQSVAGASSASSHTSAPVAYGAAFSSLDPFLHHLPTMLLQILGEAWREVGDALALQYGGSPAMHAAEFAASELAKAVEQLKERRPGGQKERRAWKAIKRSNVLIAVQRYFNNCVYDADKQRGLDLFVGAFRPWEASTEIWVVDPVDPFSSFSSLNPRPAVSPSAVSPPPSFVSKSAEGAPRSGGDSEEGAQEDEGDGAQTGASLEVESISQPPSDAVDGQASIGRDEGQSEPFRIEGEEDFFARNTNLPSSARCWTCTGLGLWSAP